MKFNVSVFRFDAAKDYNEYFAEAALNLAPDSHLADLLEALCARFDDLGVDKSGFGFRINDVVVFNNVALSEVLAHFGEDLTLTPISTKYARKDLLIDTEAVFAAYKSRLENLSFLSEESREEFRQYAALSLISPLSLEDYVGDGFCLFVKWMMLHYKPHKTALLAALAGDDGVMNALPVKHMIFPPNASIDSDIEALQKMLFAESKPHAKIAKKLEAAMRLP